MLGALGLRIRAGKKSQLRQVSEHAEHAIEQADIDQASASGYAALVQSRQYAHRAIDPTHQVAQRNPKFGRWPVRLAVDAERPGQGLHDDVEGGAVAQRAVHAEPRDRAIDQPRVEGGQCFVSQPQSIHDARAVVFNENVAPGCELLDQRHAGRGFQIDDDALLAAVYAQEIVTLSLTERRKGTGLVTRSWGLDLEHLRAQIGQGERGCRSRQHASEVENTNSLQRACPARSNCLMHMRCERALPRCALQPSQGSASTRAAGQLDDGGSVRRLLIAMRNGSLADFHEMPAVLDEFAADDTVDDQSVAVRIVAADLALALAQEAIIAHPVGDVMRQPGAALRAVVISARRADLERE